MNHGIVPPAFHGWRVVAGAFVLAALGWGLGFYGPPVYLETVRATRGFSIELASAAVTMHYLLGAVVVANLPGLYRRFGLPLVTCSGVVALAIGLVGWAMAREPWQLFLAAFLSGAGRLSGGGGADRRHGPGDLCLRAGVLRAGPRGIRRVLVRWLTRPLTAFNEMQQRISRLVDDRPQALAAVSHDLKTPITRLRFGRASLERLVAEAAAETRAAPRGSPPPCAC